MNFILLLILYICALYAFYGIWLVCVFFKLIEFDMDRVEDKPPPKQPPVLPSTVSKMEWVNFGDGFELVEVYDIDCNKIKID